MSFRPFVALGLTEWESNSAQPRCPPTSPLSPSRPVCVDSHTRTQQRVVVAAESERVVPAYKAMVGWTVVDPESGEELKEVR